MVNAYAEPLEEGASSQFRILPLHGYSATPLAEFNGVVRGSVFIDNKIFAIVNGALQTIEQNGTVTNLGLVPEDPTTTIAALNGEITIAAGGRRRIWNGSAFEEPTDGAFIAVGSVDRLDDRIIASEKDGRRFDWTELLDAGDLDALNFATKSAYEDNLLMVRSNDSNIWLFGAESTEIWYTSSNPANSSEAYRRIPDGVIEHGVRSAPLAFSFKDQLFWVTSDGRVLRAAGTSYEEISTSAIRDSIKRETPERIYGYEADGRSFVVIWFRNRPSWVIDLSTNLWFERSTGANNGSFEVMDAVKAWGSWYFFTKTGKVHLVEGYTDGATPLTRDLWSIPLDATGKNFRIKSLEILFETGAAGLGRDAQVRFSFSKDGGQTWTYPHYEVIGRSGKHANRVRIRGIGLFRRFCFRLQYSDDLELPTESSCFIEFN